ncbi:neuronal acetylcholine receptor subunit alpha-7-like [Lineus longissimus]|uniref:neuronal acetylcholine receptor subunit alpha-7-like n=1 Tax=Lineus longissimus TaxID=88925 RepID=UPI00315CCBB6
MVEPMYAQYLAVLRMSIFSGDFAGAVNDSTELNLASDLLDVYNPLARPVVDFKNAMPIFSSFLLRSIESVDDRKQHFTFTGTYTFYWIDGYLAWNPWVYKGIDIISLPGDRIWRPDVGVSNSVNSGDFDISENSKTRLQLKSSGWVEWSTTRVYSVKCNLDMSMFPFDTQNCKIHLESLSQIIEKLTLELMPMERRVDMLSLYMENTEWELLAIDQEIGKMYTTINSGKKIIKTFSDYMITISIKRRTTFYWVNMILPCVFISILVLMTFLMPAEAGEKISFSVTVLLAFTVYQLMIAQDLPKSSLSTPLLTIYLTMLIALSAFAVFLSILVLNIHHQDPDKPLPKWLRKVVFGCLAKVTCRGRQVRDLGLDTKKIMVHPMDYPLNDLALATVTGGKVGNKDEIARIGGSKLDLHQPPHYVVPACEFVKGPNGATQAESGVEGKYGQAWKLSAEILDRIFLILYLIVTVSAFLYFLILCPMMYESTHRLVHGNNTEKHVLPEP